MANSAFGSLNWKDVVKGFIVAAISSVLTGLFNIINDGTMPTGSEWKVIAIAGLSAGVGYIIKNWLSNSSSQFAKNEASITK